MPLATCRRLLLSTKTSDPLYNGQANIKIGHSSFDVSHQQTMPATEPITADNELVSSLEQLIINNSDLDALESMLSEFNLFEAIGVIREELKHSNLLAFLLSPNEKHGLSDRFLKKLLIAAFSDSQAAVLNSTEIDMADLADVEVRREWSHIDLLIYSPRNQWVIAIENKVDSGEHSNQLKRYEDIVEKTFSDCKKRFFLYLTRDGDPPSSKKWQQISYGTVADVLETSQIESSLSNDVQTFIKHYISLIRRHLVKDSDIAELCRKIYQQHYQALDLIYKHRPNMQLQIADFLKEIIQESEGIVLDDSNKYFIRCAPSSWDRLPFQKTCEGWTGSRRLALFEFVNYSDRLEFQITIGPGGKANQQAIFNPVKELEELGALSSKSSKRRFINSALSSSSNSPIIQHEVLSISDYIEEDWEGIQQKIKEFWDRMLSDEIRMIEQVMLSAKLDLEGEVVHSHSDVNKGD